MSSRINRDDIDKFYDYGIYVPSRTIYMGSEGADDSGETGTDFLMAERVVKGLHILDSQSANPITIVMNNLGGDEYHGLAIYDAIRACRSEVTIRATGHVMSMGTWILQAADRRELTPNAAFMIHYGQASISEHPKTVINWAKEFQRLNELMEMTYLERIREKHPKFPLAKVQKMLNFDTILTARETVDLGLADAIVD